MANLAINLNGIKSPNPFWIASGPVSNTKHQAINAFEAGWLIGAVVWKTIGNPTTRISLIYMTNSAINLNLNTYYGKFSN